MRCNLQWQKYEIEWTVKVEKFEMEVPQLIKKNVDLQGYLNIRASVQKSYENLRWKYVDFWERSLFRHRGICAFEY